jgi:hypothetical protein
MWSRSPPDLVIQHLDVARGAALITAAVFVHQLLTRECTTDRGDAVVFGCFDLFVAIAYGWSVLDVWFIVELTCKPVVVIGGLW